MATSRNEFDVWNANNPQESGVASEKGCAHVHRGRATLTQNLLPTALTARPARHRRNATGPPLCCRRRPGRYRRLLRMLSGAPQGAGGVGRKAYGDQTEQNHDRPIKAIKSGKVKAITDV